MINTQVQDWFWAWILSGYTTHVSGDVIKLNKPGSGTQESPTMSGRLDAFARHFPSVQPV